MMVRRLTRYLVQGLVITVPAVVTVWLCWVAIRWVDGLLGVGFPGAGLLVTVVSVILIGALASNYLTGPALRSIEALLGRVPFVRLLYTSSKDLLNAFVGDQRRFTQAVRVALSEDGAVAALGFVTSESLGDFGLENHVAVYLPFSYSFAGHVVVVPSSRVTPIKADSAEVMAFIVSGGISRTGGRRPPG